MYRRSPIAILRDKCRPFCSYLFKTTLPSVATALVFGLVFCVAPLLSIGNTDSSGSAASVSASVYISSCDATKPAQHDEPGHGSLASGAGLDRWEVER